MNEPVATYRIQLTDDERQQLKSIVSTGTRKAAHIRDAHLLLASDYGTAGYLGETALAEQLHISIRTVERTRKAFAQTGMAVFEPKPSKPRRPKKIDGNVEAHLLALSCTEPPAGQSRWTLRTLAERIIALQLVDSVSHTAIGTTLKKMRSSPGAKKNG